MAEYRLDFEFVAVPLELLLTDGLTPTDVAAYVALRSFTRYGKPAKVTDAEAAERGRMGDRAFRDARTRLRSLGWLEWRRTGRDNLYTIISVRGETSVLTEVRSAADAEQNGTEGGTDRQQAPNAINGERKTESGEKKPPAGPPPEREPKPEGRQTWLTPFMDQHAEITGGVAPAKLMAKVFKGLLEEVAKRNPQASPADVVAAVLTRQRRYLTHLKATGKLGEFLSYPKFAQTYGEWGRAPQRDGAKMPAQGRAYDSGDNERELDRLEQ